MSFENSVQDNAHGPIFTVMTAFESGSRILYNQQANINTLTMDFCKSQSEYNSGSSFEFRKHLDEDLLNSMPLQLRLKSRHVVCAKLACTIIRT